MLNRLMSKIASAGGRTADDVAKPADDTPFDRQIAERAGALGIEAGPDAAATAHAVLAHLMRDALARTEIDPRKETDAVAVVLAVYAAGIPMQKGLMRCGEDVQLTKLLGTTSRGLLETHHDDSARQAIVRQATDAFQNRRKREENLAKALETAGNMAFGWFTTGDPTYRDGLADATTQIAQVL